MSSNYSSPRTKSEPFNSHLLLTDQEILELGIRGCDVELYRRRHYTASFGIDTWYSCLSHLSFKSCCIPLSFLEAKAILSLHSNRNSNQRKSSSSSNGLNPLFSTSSNSIKSLYNSPSLSSPNNNNNNDDNTSISSSSSSLNSIENEIFPPVLLQLEKNLDELIRREFSDGCFVKLNTRSPKEVPIYDFENETLKKTILGEIGRLDQNQRDDNNETIAFIKATNKGLKVTSARKALELLIRSDRIYEDLSRAIQFGEHLFDMKLVVREWIEELINKPHMEFRCFVHKSRLNAITQYFSMVHFPELVENKEEILRRISEFFENELQHTLKTHNSYVVDLFLAHDRIIIIELNPFHNGAGAGLFSWATNRDILMNGPLEFRIVNRLEDLPLSPKEFLPFFWAKFINSHFHPNSQTEEEEEDVFEDSKRDKNIILWPWTVAVLALSSFLIYKKATKFEL